MQLLGLQVPEPLHQRPTRAMRDRGPTDPPQEPSLGQNPPRVFNTHLDLSGGLPGCHLAKCNHTPASPAPLSMLVGWQHSPSAYSSRKASPRQVGPALSSVSVPHCDWPFLDNVSDRGGRCGAASRIHRTFLRWLFARTGCVVCQTRLMARIMTEYNGFSSRTSLLICIYIYRQIPFRNKKDPSSQT